MLPQYIERPYKMELRNDCLLRKTQSGEQILHMINKLPNEPQREHSIHIFIYVNVCLSRLKECSDALRAVLIEIGREHNKTIKPKEQCNANTLNASPSQLSPSSVRFYLLAAGK